MQKNSVIDVPHIESAENAVDVDVQLDDSSNTQNSSENIWKRFTDKLPTTIIWALGAQGVLSITRLLTSITVGGRFGSGSEEQLGYYSSAFGVLMILVGLHEAFVTTPLTVFNQKKEDSTRARFSGNMLIASLLVIGVIAAFIAILATVQFGFRVLRPEVGAAIIAAAALAPFQLLREFSRRWLLANLAVKESAWLECLFAAIYLIALFGLVMTANVSAIAVFVALGCVNALGLVVWWLLYRSDFSFDAPTKTADIAENFRYGRWVAGENVCSTVTAYFCIWFLTYKIDEAAAGVFFGCFTVVLLANPFLLGVSSVLAPRAAQEYVQNRWQGLNRILLQYGVFIFGVLAAFAALIWIYGEPVTYLLFQYEEYFAENYGGENSVTAVLGLAMPLMGLSYVFTMGLLAIKQPQASFFSAIVGLAVLCMMNLSYTNPNLKTAAFCFVVSLAVGAACRIMLLGRAYFMRRPA